MSDADNKPSKKKPLEVPEIPTPNDPIKKAPNEAAKTFGPFAARVALQSWSGFSQTVPHAGHWVHDDEPDFVAGTILLWVGA